MATTSTFGWPTPDDTDLVRDGAADIRALGSAIDETVGSGYVYAGTRDYTSSGTFEKADAFGDSSNVAPRAIRVRAIGGGGGGAGGRSTSAGQAHAGAAGGGASYAESWITDMGTLAASEPVTVGAGGAGGSGSGNGSAGTASTFGTLAIVSASGGLGGFNQGVSSSITAYPGAAEQTGGTGDVVFSGSPGHFSFVNPGGFTISGPGGSSVLGAGGKSVEAFGSSTGQNGQAGGNYGGGGSGAITNQLGQTFAGGTGGAGLVRIDVFV